MKKGTVADGLVYHAGFPNAAEDRPAVGLSIDDYIVGHRASTFFWRLEAGIPELNWPADSIVVVDRSLPVRQGNVVVAVVDEAFLLCRYHARRLVRLTDGTPVENEYAMVWGVATYTVQPLR